MMKKTLLLLSLLLIFRSLAGAKPPYIVVLGIAQDAGVPQMGCNSPFCRKTWKDPQLRRMVSSIALVNPDTKERWIFDATPDLPEQFQNLKETTGDFSNDLAGIFLTHAHIGHYTGLMFLGRESMNTKGVKVYAMPRMKRMLETNAPWSQLVGIDNIELQPLEDRQRVRIGEKLWVEPFLVPHRDEFSETVGFKITFEGRSVVFIPDIDKWQKWNMSLKDLVRTSNYLFIDGTFYQDGELSRPMSEVPHPFVSETMNMLKELSAADRSKIYFIHFNHTNPLVQGNREKIREVTSKGFNIAFQGQKIEL